MGELAPVMDDWATQVRGPDRAWYYTGELSAFAKQALANPWQFTVLSSCGVSEKYDFTVGGVTLDSEAGSCPWEKLRSTEFMWFLPTRREKTGANVQHSKRLNSNHAFLFDVRTLS